MTPLQWDIRNVLKANRDGARTTQYQRQAMLFRFAGDLQRLGHRGVRLAGLGNRHVLRAVAHWKNQGLSDATVMNRLSAIRWLGTKIGKSNLGYDRNRVFGLQGRSPASGSKAERLTVSVTRHVDDPYVRVSLKLQAAFGLRRSEAMKIQPRWADRGDRLVLKGSWTKGGRPRDVPLRTAYQRGVLEEAKRIAKNGALIPPHKSYRQHLHTWEHLTRGAGLSKTHGLRHAYAQARYRALTGRVPTRAGPPGRRCVGKAGCWITRRAGRLPRNSVTAGSTSPTSIWGADHDDFERPDACLPQVRRLFGAICPLDADWPRRIHRKGEPVCFYLLESVKPGARARFEGSMAMSLYHAMERSIDALCARHAPLRRAVERAKRTGSRLNPGAPSAGDQERGDVRSDDRPGSVDARRFLELLDTKREAVH